MEDDSRKFSVWFAKIQVGFSKNHKRNKKRMVFRWNVVWVCCVVFLAGILMYSWPVHAQETVPQSVTIDPKIEKEILWVGDEVELPVTVSPKEAADTKLNWEVSDPQVFEVVKRDDQTILIVKKMGKATITVKAGEVSASVELWAWDLVLPLSLVAVAVVIGIFVVVIAMDENKKRVSQTKDLDQK